MQAFYRDVEKEQYRNEARTILIVLARNEGNVSNLFNESQLVNVLSLLRNGCNVVADVDIKVG